MKSDHTNQQTAQSESDGSEAASAPTGTDRKIRFITSNGLWLVPTALIACYAIALAVSWIHGLDNIGVAGDAFGIANALFSGLAFWVVAYALLEQQKSISIQEKDLRATHEELRRSTSLAEQASTERLFIASVNRFESALDRPSLPAVGFNIANHTIPISECRGRQAIEVAVETCDKALRAPAIGGEQLSDNELLRQRQAVVASVVRYLGIGDIRELAYSLRGLLLVGGDLSPGSTAEKLLSATVSSNQVLLILIAAAVDNETADVAWDLRSGDSLLVRNAASRLPPGLPHHPPLLPLQQ